MNVLSLVIAALFKFVPLTLNPIATIATVTQVKMIYYFST